MKNEENITLQETSITNASPNPASATKVTAKQILTNRLKACYDAINADVAANVATVIDKVHTAASSTTSGIISVVYNTWNDVKINNSYPIELTWAELYGGFPVLNILPAFNVAKRISDLFRHKLNEALLEEGFVISEQTSKASVYLLYYETCTLTEDCCEASQKEYDRFF